MRYFAELNSNNDVLRVLVIDPEWTDSQVTEYLAKVSGNVWKETKKGEGSAGQKYHPDIDRFLPEKPFTGWILNKDKNAWVPPKSYPQNGKTYRWDNTLADWKETGSGN